MEGVGNETMTKTEKSNDMKSQTSVLMGASSPHSFLVILHKRPLAEDLSTAPSIGSIAPS